MDEYLSKIKVNVGERWHADKVWFDSNGEQKYLFVILDHITRFCLATDISDRKNKHKLANCTSNPLKLQKNHRQY